MPVTFTAQLSPTASIAPTGTVTFYDQSVGGALLGTAPIGANGQAVLSVTTIGPGVHSITASYSGDPIFPASNSNANNGPDRRITHPSRGQQQHQHPARHHGRVHAPGDAAGRECIPVHGKLYRNWSACGRNRQLLSRDPGSRQQDGEHHHDGRYGRDRLERAFPVTSACHLLWGYCFL